ncbi:MAG: GDP-mannose 4,6-dehydratase [Clostridia bacterium]|nr:GDP-mannose 4,6-dehydratase [Clostridia bacterium]
MTGTRTKKKTALIIGAAGFVGNYLAQELKSAGRSVLVTRLQNERYDGFCDGEYCLDVTDAESVRSVIGQARPDEIYHLAAQSSVAVSWKKPGLTVDVNIRGAVNLLEAVRECAADAVVLLIGSAEEYGAVTPEECPIKEEHPTHPKNIYAMTKAAQNMTGKLYCDAYGMKVRMVRAFNHFGPGQAPQFVISDFCRQVAEIESGARQPIMKVGNLDAKRDFTDVRDIVRAYRMLAESGVDGATYNVGSGKAVSIRDMLDTILSLSTAQISVEKDPLRLRPSDVPLHCADIGRISRDVGWHPEIPREETVLATLDYWRSEIKKNG